MKIGLIDVDGHNFPNLCLMKLSAWHKAQGDTVDWWDGFDRYDRVYMSRVFTDEYSADEMGPVNADEIVKGGTGYGLEDKLPDDVEHSYQDYGLYPKLTANTAYGFLTRGCPRACGFCIVAALARVKTKMVHFALDDMPQMAAVARGLELYAEAVGGVSHRTARVYILTNYNTTHEQDMERVRLVQSLGYGLYVMIYNKSTAPRITRDLQRWSNSPYIYNAQPDFEQYRRHG